MVNIDKNVLIKSSKRTSKRHFVRALKGFGIFLSVVIILAAAENNWFGYAWRSAQLFVQGDDGAYGIANSPDLILANAATTADDTLTVLAVGDIVSCPEADGLLRDVSTLTNLAGFRAHLEPSSIAATQTVALAQKWPTAPILALGDIVYRRGTPYEFADCFDPIWGKVSNRTLPAPGNHEYYTPAAFAYFDYWGRQAGPNRRGYYAVKRNNWLILSLNSEIDADPTSPQGIWLAETLATASEGCTLAYYHRPAYSSQTRKGSGSEQALFKQLTAGGADIILNGHNHLYERTHPMNSRGEVVAKNGTVSFVVGTGGRSAAGDMQVADFTAKAAFGVQGILQLDLRNDDYGWAFHSVDTPEILDEGRRTCRTS